MFLTNLADVLRAYTAPDGSKLTVVETAGWKNRGYNGQGIESVAGVLWHHTATAESSFARSNAPTLNTLINGHSNLPGPLSQLGLGRDGTVYVVAAGLCNHAGAGRVGNIVNTGNYHLIGIEMESSGIRDDWTEAQRRVMPHLGAALEKGYAPNNPDFIQIGHKEYSSQGKIDPAYINMDTLRSSINDLLYNRKSVTTSAAPAPVQTNTRGNGENAPHWVVEKGDSLAAIARHYFGSATTADIKKLTVHNKIADPSKISVGQKIFIPGPLRWTVEPGDTWAKIDAYYGYDASSNWTKNRNPGKSMTVGTVLNIWD